MSQLPPLKNAPRIFLSYSGRDSWWVEQFCENRAFTGQLGTIVLQPYSDGGNLAFGNLEDWLDDQMASACAVIAFVSRNYLKEGGNKWTGYEWRKAIEAQNKGRLLFVPVMLDHDAINSWSHHKRAGGFADLPTDFQYSNFSGGDVPKKIGELGQQLAKLGEAISKTLLTAPPPPPPRSPPLAPPASPRVVLLGHPSGARSDDFASEVGELKSSLEAANITVTRGPDGWSSSKQPWDDTSSFAESTNFVQPLETNDVVWHIEDRHTISRWLEKRSIKKPLVTLWLPERYGDDDFAKAAKGGAPGDWPTLRIDTPARLADWLSGLLQPSRTDTLVLQLEALGSRESVAADPESRRLDQQLETSLTNAVSGEVSAEPAAWRFEREEQVIDQIGMLPTSRAVFAIHDLSKAESNAHSGAVFQEIDAEVKRRRKQIEMGMRHRKSGQPLKVFKAVLMVSRPDAGPFASWPHDPADDPWHVLQFQPRSHAAIGELPDVQPKSLSDFRANLRYWAANR